MRIAPMAHHIMGGVCIDAQGATSEPGLFAAGEVTGGLHGANRMGGNALTETQGFGARAGRASLNIEGLWVSAPVVTWRETHIVVTIPSGLEEIVGSTEKSARILVCAEKNAASTVVRIGPDLSRITPEITSSSPTVLKPGELLFVEGRNFSSREGKVYFDVRSLGVIFMGIIDHWDPEA